jgi:glycosyltransferase involved in cell wall biosynthesis
LKKGGTVLNSQPLVSVGIPTYNRPEGLRRTLECLTKQTYPNLEILVSDNCSPSEATDRVVSQFTPHDSRIRYYKQIENKGAGFNFNYLLKQATGDYFMWAADDDQWVMTYVETCLQELIKLGQDFIGVTMEANYFSNSGLFPFFAEGKPFYDASHEDIATRLLHVLKYNYGNLIYGVFQKAALFKDSSTIIELLDYQFENEIPLFLYAATFGNFRVLPEVGLYKKTTPGTYLQARWEVGGGKLPNSDVADFELCLKPLHAYHQRTMETINKAIDLLPVSMDIKAKLRQETEKYIREHYAFFVNRFKEPKL